MIYDSRDKFVYCNQSGERSPKVLVCLHLSLVLPLLCVLSRFFTEHREPKKRHCYIFRYMKYLYPYECDKLSLSAPDELQSAIDGNRREGRRGTQDFGDSPVRTDTHASRNASVISQTPISRHSDLKHTNGHHPYRQNGKRPRYSGETVFLSSPRKLC